MLPDGARLPREKTMVTVTEIDDGHFMSTLEVPKGNDINQNAWLTLTINYQLTFADSRNRVAGVIFQQRGRWVAKDADTPPKFFPIVDWAPPPGSKPNPTAADLKAKFQNAFQRGERIWNWQFVLITPKRYDELDYESMSGAGWVVRPNVLCLFRLVPFTASQARTPSNGSNRTAQARLHLPITVVRLAESQNSSQFRSNARVYDDGDVWSPTLGHELGHALGQGHIKEILGDGQCIADAARGVYPDRCYGETPAERANIMGAGTSIWLANAKPWLDRIAQHSTLPRSDWQVTGVMDTPPRKIPLGVALVAKPSEF
jgi:hypothetical protein